MRSKKGFAFSRPCGSRAVSLSLSGFAMLYVNKYSNLYFYEAKKGSPLAVPAAAGRYPTLSLSGFAMLYVNKYSNPYFCEAKKSSSLAGSKAPGIHIFVLAVLSYEIRKIRTRIYEVKGSSVRERRPRRSVCRYFCGYVADDAHIVR